MMTSTAKFSEFLVKVWLREIENKTCISKNIPMIHKSRHKSTDPTLAFIFVVFPLTSVESSQKFLSIHYYADVKWKQTKSFEIRRVRVYKSVSCQHLCGTLWSSVKVWTMSQIFCIVFMFSVLIQCGINGLIVTIFQLL